MTASFMFEKGVGLSNAYIHIDANGDLQKDENISNRDYSVICRTFRWLRAERDANSDCLYDIVLRLKAICRDQLKECSSEELKHFLENLKQIQNKVEAHNENSRNTWLSYKCPNLNREIRQLSEKIPTLTEPVRRQLSIQECFKPAMLMPGRTAPVPRKNPPKKDDYIKILRSRPGPPRRKKH